MVYKLSINYAIGKHESVELKAKKLGHVIEDGEYKVFCTAEKEELALYVKENKIKSEREAFLKIRCNAHSSPNTEPIQTTYHNY